MTDTAHMNEKRTPFDDTAAGQRSVKPFHASDCAVHNEPAMPNGPCDCGADVTALDNVDRAADRLWPTTDSKRQKMKQEPPPLPTSIRVGFRHYQVIEWDQMDSSCEDRFGDQSMAQARIRVAAGINAEKQANVLLHEVMHACYDQAALNGGEKEEAVVWSLSNVLCQVWQDNPDLIAFLDAALGQPKNEQS